MPGQGYAYLSEDKLSENFELGFVSDHAGQAFAIVG
jgi:hypothetical protein